MDSDHGHSSNALKITLQFVSQAAHIGFGYIFLTIPVLLTGSFTVMWWTLGALVAGEGAKEYWDCHGLEDPATSGGVSGSWEDFAFWVLGNVIGVLTLIAARKLGHI